MNWVLPEITATLPAQSAWWKLEEDASLIKPAMEKNQTIRTY
jgi:outer membrane protein TolC